MFGLLILMMHAHIITFYFYETVESLIKVSLANLILREIKYLQLID